MTRSPSLLLSCVGCFAIAALANLASCSGSSGPPTFTQAGSDASGDDSASGDDADQNLIPDGGGEGGCVNLQCQQVDCGAQGKPPTTISGTVITATPAQYGTPDPIYDAIVYVPNATVDKFKPGVTCDKCGTAVSGNPVVVALSDTSGHFTLKNAPSGQNIPIVVQIGRWRRQQVIPNVAACQDNPIPKDLTRLPHNQKEGDIPHIAIATSVFDAEECVLLKMGVDEAEFTIPSQNGRIHLYTGTGSSLPGQPDMTQLWKDTQTLEQYDIVQFPCESVPQIDQPPGQPGQNLQDYANAGGRVFATDLSYPWYKWGPGNWPQTAVWTNWTGVSADPLPSIIDTSFPKGKALADWMQKLGATTTYANIDIHDTYHVVDGVNAPSTRWLYSTTPDATVQTYSFNTPVGVPDDKQCGRAVFHNSHVAGEQFQATTFPQECSQAPLTPQERLMEFMLLDLAACVQKDTDPPKPPPQ